MPWKEVTDMEEKIRFVSLLKTNRYTMTELCEDFGISRKTGHKYVERYEAEGLRGLEPRSHRTKACPHRTDEEVERLIVLERTLHRTWGPKKLQRLLEVRHGIEKPPAQSTIGEILKRHGLSVPRRRKPGIYHALNDELTIPNQPNHVWTVDFKGWFTLGNGSRCDPLTVCDRYSHYVLCCRAQANQQYIQTRCTFQSIMSEHGLPQVIRVDHGTPFASYGLGRFSQLSIWWVEQGIEVEFTRIAHPQDNGSHERMHKDLKAESTIPPSPDLRTQQKRFDLWRDEYNHERPHEALDQKTPAEVYRVSHRKVDEHQLNITYPKSYLVKQVSSSGFLSHEGHNYHVGEVFAGKKVGLFVNRKKQTELHYANIHLGNLHYDPEERWRPTATIVPPDQQPKTKKTK
jgi:transposase InsO family protein